MNEPEAFVLSSSQEDDRYVVFSPQTQPRYVSERTGSLRHWSPRPSHRTRPKDIPPHQLQVDEMQGFNLQMNRIKGQSTKKTKKNQKPASLQSGDKGIENESFEDRGQNFCTGQAVEQASNTTPKDEYKLDILLFELQNDSDSQGCYANLQLVLDMSKTPDYSVPETSQDKQGE